MTHSTLADPHFEQLLGDCDIVTLLASDETIYGLWPDLTLAFVNQGWTQFARRNNAEPAFHEKWPLGRRIVDAIALPLRPFFETHYARSLIEERPWEHSYECSTAELFRKFHMLVFPVGNAEGLLVVNSLRIETTHSRTPAAPVERLYRNEYSILTQCSHCRRVRRMGIEHTWDWVPDWVTKCPPNTSHGLCEPCIGFHYSQHRSNIAGFVESFQSC